MRPTTNTVKLETSYKKPVRVPGDYLLRCWVTGKEGRKTWVRGELCGSDGREMLAEGKVLCVESRPKAVGKL